MQTFQYDPEDEPLVAANNWYISKGGYVRRGNATGERSLHRLIMNPPPGMEVDHIDGNPSNNTRANLRICTHQQNAAARRMPKRDLPRGVGYDPNTGKYQAAIRVNGKSIWLGRFTTIEEAKAVRDAAAVEHFGSFAVIDKWGE